MSLLFERFGSEHPVYGLNVSDFIFGNLPKLQAARFHHRLGRVLIWHVLAAHDIAYLAEMPPTVLPGPIFTKGKKFYV